MTTGKKDNKGGFIGCFIGFCIVFIIVPLVLHFMGLTTRAIAFAIKGAIILAIGVIIGAIYPLVQWGIDKLFPDRVDKNQNEKK